MNRIALVFLILLSSLFSQEMNIRGRYYLDHQPISINIQQGHIVSLTRIDAADLPDETIYLAPGFIDVQINGYAGVDFCGDGLASADVYRAAQALWREGVTTFFPTLITNSVERLSANFRVLAGSADDPSLMGSIAGFHLEGPFISPVDGFRGAHLAEYVRPADIKEFKTYQTAAQNKIRFLTLAPEATGALDLIHYAVQTGLIVGIGHTGATAEQIRAAADAGATISTHLGNGCANMIHRHQNPLWPQLADSRLRPTLIADGHHLLPEEVITFVQAKGRDNVMLISDALDLAGMPPGEYWSGGKKVVMTQDGMLKYPEQNVLAGASAPISAGIAHVMQFTQCSLAEAIHMATCQPAQFFTLDDRGTLSPGKRADIVMFTLDHNRIQVVQTILSGQCVYKAE